MGVSLFSNTLFFFLVHAPLKSSGIDCLEELELLPFTKRPFILVLHFFSGFLIVVLFDEDEVKYDVVLAFLELGMPPYLESTGSWTVEAMEFVSEFASDTEPFLDGANSDSAGSPSSILHSGFSVC